MQRSSTHINVHTKENINSPRLMGFPEDLQHARNYEMKIENESNADTTVTVTPIR